MDSRTNRGDQTAASPEPRDENEFARALREQMATVTGGLAPDVYTNAWWTWYLNLARQPPKQIEIMHHALASMVDTWTFAARAATGQPAAPAAASEHFRGDEWTQWPFNVYAHTYHNYVDWWKNALSSVPGVAPDSERTLDFMARNALEVISPAHYLATNPQLLETTDRKSVV